MLQDSKTKIEVIRMQILQAVQTNELAFDNGDGLMLLMSEYHIDMYPCARRAKFLKQRLDKLA